jgi:ABC-type nickel/cobalt efflux system permease component RcnA
MLNFLAVILVGLLLGLRHATDPDHVVAVTTIVSQQRSLWRAGAIGALWGIGHTVTLVVVGGGLILFRVAVSPRVGLSMELAVALMLIALGLYALFADERAIDRYTAVRPLLVGTVHGFAGSGFASTLPVLAAIDQPRWALAYLAVFGMGTILGMMAVTAAIAVPSWYAAARMTSARRYLRLASGALSVAFGLFLVHRIGVVDGLFTSHPEWTPK